VPGPFLPSINQSYQVGIWALEHVLTVSALLRFARLCGSRRGILTAAGRGEWQAVQVASVGAIAGLTSRYAVGTGLGTIAKVGVLRGNRSPSNGRPLAF
jgi:hypothetical protein